MSKKSRADDATRLPGPPEQSTPKPRSAALPRVFGAIGVVCLAFAFLAPLLLVPGARDWNEPMSGGQVATMFSFMGLAVLFFGLGYVSTPKSERPRSGHKVTTPDPGGSFQAGHQTMEGAPRVRQVGSAIGEIVSLTCAGCGKEYNLGHDAFVVTAAGVLRDFKAAIIVGGAPSGPDFVASVDWATLDDDEKRNQRLEVAGIAAFVRQGLAREWRCRGCQRVNVYDRLPK